MHPDEGAIRERLASTLLPALGLDGEEFAIESPEQEGTRSSLFVIEGRRLPRLLVRAFRRRAAAGRNAVALRHLESLDLPAPRLVYQDLSWGSRLVAGGLPFLTVETWIEGSRVSGLERPGKYREALPWVAAILARFHEVTRPGWGRPSRSRSWATYVSHALRQVRATLRRVEARGWIDPQDSRRVLADFESWRERIGALASFSLLHKDPNPDNFILTPERKIVPVDLHRIGYGPFQEDLVTAQHHFCPDDQEGEDLLREAYFRRSKADRREEYEATLRFFRPLYFLKKLALRTREYTDPERTPELRRFYCEEMQAVRPPG